MDKNTWNEWSVQPEVVGWRIWAYSGSSLLSPVFSHVVWPSDGPLEAYCRAINHTPPGANHVCGIWATKFMPPTTAFPESPLLTVGLVRLWGTVAVHGDEGWRGQFARPVALINRRINTYDGSLVPDSKSREIARIADQYAVPCIDVDDPCWVAAARELGAPSTKWLGPPLHNYHIIEGWSHGLPARIVTCGCGYEQAYRVSFGNYYPADHPWTEDWIRHWASLEDQP